MQDRKLKNKLKQPKAVRKATKGPGPVKTKMGATIYSMCPTQFTMTGVMDMNNQKPYRTKSQMVDARQEAYKTTKGFYVAPRHLAPVTIRPINVALSRGQVVAQEVA